LFAFENVVDVVAQFPFEVVLDKSFGRDFDLVRIVFEEIVPELQNLFIT
jgi:hypothetical protein